MFEIAAELRTWCGQGRDFAVATVVAVGGSAPRGLGAALAVDAGGAAVGSVSGGCVEGAVYELCREAIRTGEPVLTTFGPDDDDPFLAALTCGGVIDVLVTPVLAGTRDVLGAALDAVAAGRPAALVHAVEGPREVLGRPLLVHADGTCSGTLGGPAELDRAAVRETLAQLGPVGGAGRFTVSAGRGRCEGPVTLFAQSNLPAPRMLVFGAVDFAGALARVGGFLGYRVTVCDARPVFATRERFPDAHEVVVDWPDRYLRTTDTDTRTVVCVLTHDPKFDVPLLKQALALPVAYIGAMGSRRTHHDRLARLLASGVPEVQLARLHSPIGLDLGAHTPQETALSIAAEIVAAARGGSGQPLTGGHTPIHKDSAVARPRPELLTR
jgi:xanthine dehydrogenase accessory factor